MQEKSVRYRFFSRSNGVSIGNFAGLNGSKFVGDDLENVSRNWNIVANELKCHNLIFLDQIHSNKVVYVNGQEEFMKADAMVTDKSGIVLGIVTADCAPVLLYDNEKRIIGASHAGWKGAVSGVIENTVEAMKNLGAENIFAEIGPCIHVDSYEVDRDFCNNFSDADDCFIEKEGIHFDLVKFCKKALLKSGVENIKVSDIDTYVNHNEYFSYRYARYNTDGICGRNISAICLE